MLKDPAVCKGSSTLKTYYLANGLSFWLLPGDVLVPTTAYSINGVYSWILIVVLSIAETKYLTINKVMEEKPYWVQGLVAMIH